MSPREAKLVKLLLVLVATLLVAGVIVGTVNSQRAYQQDTCEMYPEAC